MSVNDYVGLLRGEQFRWLRENFDSVGHVACSHLLFRVTPEALQRVTDPLPPRPRGQGEPIPREAW